MDVGEAFVYVIPLKRLYSGRKSNRAKRAVDLVRNFVSKHTKIEPENVVITDDVNSYIWSRSIEKPPRRIKVLVEITELKPEEGEGVKRALVRLAGERIKIGKYEIKPRENK
jgi:large subunit ribosomal protein L31e|nr:50S ribosomal protein L31e [Caldisphaera sp.]PMP60970.1 MAG: 50S ribosomal protein L31e [Caldisphaera sp.]